MNPQENRVLATQLATSRASWEALRRRGVDESSDVRMDFFYAAPDELHAKALAAFFAIATGYDVCVVANKRGFFQRTTWTVNGTSTGVKPSREILDRWVTWMVLAGIANDCELTRWSAQAP